MIPEFQLPDDIGASIRRLIASEPAYYAHKDQLYAGYQAAIAEGREPTREERREGRQRRARAAGRALAEARRTIQHEARRIRDGAA